MTTNELVTKLQLLDPTGTARVRFPDGIPVDITRYDNGEYGPVDYLVDGKYVSDAIVPVIDIHTIDLYHYISNLMGKYPIQKSLIDVLASFKTITNDDVIPDYLYSRREKIITEHYYSILEPSKKFYLITLKTLLNDFNDKGIRYYQYIGDENIWKWSDVDGIHEYPQYSIVPGIIENSKLWKCIDTDDINCNQWVTSYNNTDVIDIYYTYIEYTKTLDEPDYHYFIEDADTNSIRTYTINEFLDMAITNDTFFKQFFL